MKKILLTFLGSVILFLCLTGCGITPKKEMNNDTTKSNNTAQANDIAEDADTISKELYSKVYEAYGSELGRYSEEKIEGNYDLEHDCVAIKDVFAESYPELLAVSPYHFSKKGYIEMDTEFTIKMYRELAEQNTKLLYADYEFIKADDNIKGYAVLLKRDGTIVLHKYSDTSSEYAMLEKDGEERFLSRKTIKVNENQCLMDDETVSQEIADNNIAKLLKNLDCILIKDGVVAGEVEQAGKGLSSEQMNPHNAKVMCFAKSVEYTSEELAKEKVWGEFAGRYSSGYGKEDEKENGDFVEITIDKDGSFIGEYKSAVQKVDKEVDGMHVEERVTSFQFQGTFCNARKLDDIQYYVECNDFTYVKDEGYELKDGVLYSYQREDWFPPFSRLILYKKGAKLADVPEDINEWYEIFAFYQNKEIPDELDRNVIENIYTSGSKSFFYQQGEEE